MADSYAINNRRKTKNGPRNLGAFTELAYHHTQNISSLKSSRPMRAKPGYISMKEYENKRKEDLQCEDNIAGGTSSSSGG